MTRFASVLCGAVMVAFGLAATPAAAADTVAKIKAAGRLNCAVVTEETDYNKGDLHGGLDDLGREVCKAVAIAALGDSAQVRVVAVPVEQVALEALRKGDVDLAVGITPGATTAWHYGVQFGPPVFLDSLTFMVHAQSGIRSMKDLAGKGVCYVLGTENERFLYAAMKAHGINYVPMPFQEEGEMEAGLVVGHCDAVAADLSKLAEARAAFHKQVAAYVMLPERLTMDPAAPAYRAGDARWAAIVDWTVYALVQAEVSGVTRANVMQKRGTGDITIEHLTGEDFATARALDLAHDWAVHVIAAVGNYGEIYERTVGKGADLRLPRDLNALWTQGGLIYPLPVR